MPLVIVSALLLALGLTQFNLAHYEGHVNFPRMPGDRGGEGTVVEARPRVPIGPLVERGTPAHIRSDNGPEFTAAAVRKWLGQVGVGTLFIEPGSPWENGYVESFNGKFRSELLNRELFDTLLEAQVLVERWRHEYNTFRPHSALGYRPPGPEAMEPKTALRVR